MMGPAIQAGSSLATIQSIAMTDATYMYGSMFGDSIGGDIEPKKKVRNSLMKNL